MNRTLKLAIFAVVAAAQLAAPAWMIGQREWVLRHGTVYKFRTAPVDPYDPFRGRYVQLGFDDLTATWPGPGPVPEEFIGHGSPICATVTTGPNGFAQFGTVSVKPPASGDYLRVHTTYYWEANSSDFKTDRVRVVLPFDRYYMNEAAAPAAERIYREHSRVSNRDAYVTVRVLNGYAVLDGLYIGDQRIEDFLKTESATPEAPR